MWTSTDEIMIIVIHWIHAMRPIVRSYGRYNVHHSHHNNNVICTKVVRVEGCRQPELCTIRQSHPRMRNGRPLAVTSRYMHSILFDAPDFVLALVQSCKNVSSSRRARHCKWAIFHVYLSENVWCPLFILLDNGCFDIFEINRHVILALTTSSLWLMHYLVLRSSSKCSEHKHR